MDACEAVKKDGEEDREVEDEDSVCDGASVDKDELWIELENEHRVLNNRRGSAEYAGAHNLL